jgi:hypothetical protein
VDTKELVVLNPLNYSPIDVNGGGLRSPFPVIHYQLLCLAHVEQISEGMRREIKLDEIY